MIFVLKFQSGIIPQKMWVELQFMVSASCFSDRALYLYQVSLKLSWKYQSYRADTNGRPDTQNFGGYNMKPLRFYGRA